MARLDSSGNVWLSDLAKQMASCWEGTSVSAHRSPPLGGRGWRGPGGFWAIRCPQGSHPLRSSSPTTWYLPTPAQDCGGAPCAPQGYLPPFSLPVLGALEGGCREGARGHFLILPSPFSAVTPLRTMSRPTQDGTGHPSEYTPGLQAPCQRTLSGTRWEISPDRSQAHGSSPPKGRLSSQEHGQKGLLVFRCEAEGRSRLRFWCLHKEGRVGLGPQLERPRPWP